MEFFWLFITQHSTRLAPEPSFCILNRIELSYSPLMQCVVTAGPTFEPLDKVRRLTNFSTGRLGSELAAFLTAKGHKVILLIGQQASWRGGTRAERVETFTTTSDLRERLKAQAGQGIDAVFHAAAISDFSFGKVWVRSPEGELSEVNAGKISTRQGQLLAELVPTPKIISELRGWYPSAQLVGWKNEVDGDRSQVISLAEKQIKECRMDACVANGPAFGAGFGLVRLNRDCLHLADTRALFASLEQLATK